MNIEVIGLSKTFGEDNGHGGLTVLDDINFAFSSGEFVSLVGPSGCGKTTLIEIIAGLQSQTRGQILLDHAPVQGNNANCAVVFQQYGLFPWLTVQKNIEYGLKIRRVDKKERRRVSGTFIHLVGLEGFEKFYPHQLSGGMQQRVALARALAVSPDILLLDEPFAALDAQTREFCQKELLTLWQRTGVTVLFVTHDVGEALFLSDRVLVMSSKPGAIRTSLEVDFPRPRGFDIRIEDRFRKMELKIRRLLRDASAHSPVEEKTP